MTKQTNNKQKMKRANRYDLSDDFEEIQSMRSSRDKEYMANLNFKIDLKFKNKKQKELYNIIKENRISFVNGSAGTGKTIITLLTALELLKSGEIKKIIITKPIVEASNSIGFLPGDIQSKVEIYQVSFYDNIEKIIGKEWTNYLKTNNLITAVPLNYMRGNTLGGVNHLGEPVGYFCILDEMQNATVKDIKLFISRLGEKTKLCLLGDSEQTDLKLRRGEISSVSDSFNRFQGISEIGFIEFTDDDIVRDPLLIEIMKRYRDNNSNNYELLKK